ncbi:MAG: glycosyltransferase [Lachnospiraceae bacterium]|nr:glycosyltransferase [Lachnospiraceae bacterium]
MNNTTKNPLISIAIASYNYAKYLKKAITMIKKSEFRDFEIVYCDDCSTDDSVLVIREIIEENNDLSIRLIENEKNLGILATKTKLFYECKGKYIMLCDADDYMVEHCLDKLASVAIKTDADRIVSEVYDVVIDKNGKEKILQKQDIPLKTSKWLWNLNHGCLYKREIFVKNHIKLDFIPDDVCLTTYFSIYSKSVAWVRKPLYCWCVHEDSAGRKKEKINNYRLVNDFDLAVTKIDFISKKCTDIHKEELELLLIKLYYLQIFQGLKKCSLKDKYTVYSELKYLMDNRRSKYLENIYIKNPKKMPLRKYAKIIVLLSASLEKLHLMKAGLLGYHLLSKVIYFDQ